MGLIARPRSVATAAAWVTAGGFNRILQPLARASDFAKGVVAHGINVEVTKSRMGCPAAGKSYPRHDIKTKQVIWSLLVV